MIAFFAAVLGIVPWTTIDSRRLARGVSLFGLTCFQRQWELDRLAAIETSCESDDRPPDPTGLMEYALFGHQPLIWRFCGWLLPWIGGEYRLVVRLKSGRRLHVWQGNNANDFRHNMALLKQHADLPVLRG